MTLQWQRTVDTINKFEQKQNKNNQPGQSKSNNNNNNNNKKKNNKDDDYEFRNKIYYCGYTMDDERRAANNFHYARHPKRNKNSNFSRQPGAINSHHQPGQIAVRNVPNSTTDPIQYNNNILDL
eukprot:423050_1